MGNDTSRYRESVDQYLKKLKKAEEKKPPRKSFPCLAGDESPAPLYTALDTESMDWLADLGFPGEPPFTRGVQPNMYRGRLWTMRQYAGFATAAETNRRYRFLLEKGQTGLSVAFDLPTQIGYDSDHVMARGEIGKVGVAIDSIEDMETLFDEIPLDKVSTSMTINSTASIVLAMYITVAKRRGIDPASLQGTVQNDILKEYVARGTYIFPPGPSMRLVTDLFRFCGGSVPSWNVISISGYHMREAGCDAVQEVAFTLADGIEYVKSAIEAGLNVEEFGGRLSFFFNCHQNFLEEVAKFRAARRLWCRLMQDRFGVKSPRASALRFHTQTAGCSLTARQPLNNVVRVTLQTLAAVLGGTQSLHTNSYDEALALPTEEAVKVALRTQQVVGYESGVADFVDPLGGSYAVESLTSRIEEKAREYIASIDEMGGMTRAIEKGYVQKEIQNTSYQYQLSVEEKKRVVVGVNQFIDEEEKVPPTLKIDPAVEREQVERLGKFKAGRDEAAWTGALEKLENAARDPGAALFEHILASVEAGGTVGEISDVLRKVFGEYKGAPVL
jgi:methylmalonyl-CoA mutase N-terminal domain/subunit